MRPVSTFFGISRPDALNKYLYELFDPRDFEFVLESYETIIGKPLTIDEYNLTVEQTLVYLPNQHGVMGILRDVSAEGAAGEPVPAARGHHEHGPRRSSTSR